jgi:hypothetical protein
MKLIKFLSAVVLITALGCEQVTENNNTASGGNWQIDKSNVYDGGPGRDGIPSIDNPKFKKKEFITYLNENDLVVGIKHNGVTKAYPHQILDWHEIVNDDVGDVKVAITYCPLTGSALAWDRVVDGKTTTFGVSGLLYNNNLIPYDRNTGSNWSQMLVESISGKMAGEKAETYNVVETTWENWKEMYPNTLVLTRETGYNRDYGIYPYGDYKSNHTELLFPVTNTDDRLKNKQRVLGVKIGNAEKAYPLNTFAAKTFVTHDNVGGTEVVVAGNIQRNFIVAFEQRLNDGTLLEFEAVDDQGQVILTDNEGNNWNIFGKAVSGPRTGQKLSKPLSYIAYWFAWAAFYPETDVRKRGD